MIKAWLLDVDYVTEHGRAIIRLWCKDERGVFVAYDRNFLPYFYVLREDGKPKAEDILNVKVRTKGEIITPLKVEEVTVKSLGKEVEAFKVYARHPQHVPKLREEIKRFAEVREADIPFAYRYLIDKDLACLDGILIEPTSERSGVIRAYEIKSVKRDERPDFPELKVLAFDCEMLSEFGMPNAEEDPIIVIGVKSGDFEELYHGDNEREVILRFVNAIKKLDPDVIVGYNQNAFDWPYLKKRAEKHGIRLDIGRDRSELTIRGGKPKIAGRLNVDLYDIALKMSDVKIKKLENVAEYLGTKVEIADIEAKDIYKYWTKGERERVLRYAKQDVLNTYFIAEELLPMHYELAKIIRLPLDDVTRMGRGKQVDYLLLSEAHKIGEVAPNPLEIEESYEGAFVLEPAKGLHENVICMDFACHPEDTWVVVKGKGKVKISEVREGDYVLGKNGWHRVKRVWVYDYDGILVDINGLKCTPNHRIPVFKKNCSQNYVKDCLALAIAQGKVKGKVIRCKIFDDVANLESNGCDERRKLMGELIGIILAEGYLLKKDARYFDKSRGKERISHQHRVDICINVNEEEFRERIKYIFKRLWGIDASEIREDGRNSLRLVSYRKNVYYDVLNMLDRIDEFDPRDILRGFFEGDGSVNLVRRSIVLNQSAKNREKLKIVAKLLDKLGIGYSWYEFNWSKPVCIIEIAKRDDIVKFATLVGAISREKAEKLRKILEDKNFKVCETFYETEHIKVSITHYKGKVYDLTLEGEPYYFANGILTHNSMYPSIMIAYNISPDTLVRGECEDCYVAPEVGHKFRKWPDGFFKRILRMLIERRMEIKKKMKSLNPKSHEYKLLDIKQTALKVLINSIYGYTGWTLARWYCRECAEATTAWGRHCIRKSIKIAEDMGFEVLYGDSVSGDTVVYTNKGMRKIKDLFEKVDYRIGDKEYYIPRDLKVLTLENGKAVFKPVKYVMRHKTKKRMFRVWLSNTWFVDVTEDHSLMGYLNKSKKAKVDNVMERVVEVKPTELGKTVKSLICLKRLPYECRSRGYPREVYEFMGLFIGDGSYNSSIGSKNYYLCLSCGNDVDEIVKKVIEPLKAKGYIKNCWISKNRKGDIKVNGLKLVRLMDEFRSSNGKIIPEWLFYESEENISAFLRGLFTADGTVLIRSGKPIVRLTTTSYEIAKAVQNILLRLGIASTIFKESKPNRYLNSNPTSYSYHIYVKDWVLFREKVGFITDRKLERLNRSVVKDQKCEFRDYDFDLIHPKKVEEIEYDDYVYDIEVEGTHTFFGNNVLLHNTDSLFIKKDELSLEELEREALKLIDRLSKELPIQIEIDEYYQTIFFVEKKRYAGLTRDGRIVVKGLEVRRGDWCELAKKVQKAVIEIILKEKNPKKAVDYVKKVIEDIKAGRVPLEDYVIYKGLTKPPSKYESKQAHVKAALRAMEMGVVYPIGSKVGFVIVKGARSISDRAYPVELIEDFDGETLSIRTFAGIDKRKIDKDYYIDHQVIPAILRILERFGYTEAQIKGVSKQKTLFDFS